MGEAKGGRHCAPIGRKAIRAEFLRHFIAAQASNENRSHPAGFESRRRDSKKPATGRVTGFSIQMVPPTGCPRAALSRLACCAGKRCAFPQLRTLPGSNPGVGIAESPLPGG